MTLSKTVLDELKNLQFYFKKLYFLRLFIPAAMKRQLRALETIDIKVTNEVQIKLILGSLCGPFVRPSLFARFILFCFSGLGRFAHGELMQHVKILASNDLFSKDNIAFMANYDPLTTGLEGLQLLKNLGLNPVDRLYQRLAQIILVKQFNMNSKLNLQFYKAIAEQPELLNYATEIGIMQSVKASHPYVHKLLSVKNISDYRKAIILLARNNLLPGMVQNDCVDIQKITEAIVNALETHPRPGEMAEAVVELQKNKQLGELAFDQVKASAAPLDLAKLIGEFAERLDQQIVGKLERHRKNLEYINSYRIITIQTERRLDLDYCQTLVDFLKASQPSGVSESSLGMYNTCYTRINPNQRESLVQKLSAFIRTPALNRPWGSVFLNFLNTDISGSHFFVYMQLCTEFAERSGCVTVENAEEIVTIIQSCSKPAELLTRVQALQSQEKITVSFLQAWVAQINPPPPSSKLPEVRTQHGMTLNSNNSIAEKGLRYRQLSNNHTPPQPGILAKSSVDLENGVLSNEKSRSVLTPYAEKKQEGAPSSSSVFENIAGVVGSLIWSTPVVDKAKKNDDYDEYGGVYKV